MIKAYRIDYNMLIHSLVHHVETEACSCPINRGEDDRKCGWGIGDGHILLVASLAQHYKPPESALQSRLSLTPHASSCFQTQLVSPLLFQQRASCLPLRLHM